MVIYRWNTGAPYTAQGQRIQAELNVEGEVLFMDWDRGISGKTAPVPEGWTFLSETQRIRWIHTEYLHGRYQMDIEPMSWPDGRNVEYPLVRM